MAIVYYALSFLGICVIVGVLAKIFRGKHGLPDHELFDDEDVERYEDQAEAKWRDL